VTERGKVKPDAGEQTERRQTPTERYHELAMLVANRQPTVPEHALALTRNSKGDVQIELTVRSSDLAELEQSATTTFDRLVAKYPRTDAAPTAGE
jgi:hypothetical protein